MRLSRTLVKTLVAVSLALLVAFLTLLHLPQLALSYAYSVRSTLKDNKETQTNKYYAQASNTSFPDIQGHWAQAYIEALAARDIIAGYPDGNYRPENLVTRAEFAAIINKAFAPTSERSSSDFVDVPINYWGYQGIQSAYRGGFLEGYPSRVFQPDQRIPRVQVLVSLATGLKLRSKKMESLSYYSDAADIPEYATQAVAGATERQLVVNYPNLKQLNPNREATRAEVAAFVYQALVNASKANPITSTYVVLASRGSNNPVIVDSDRDGLPDEQEQSIGTNPNDPDTDKDGINDGLEVAQGTDPNAPNPTAKLPPKTPSSNPTQPANNPNPTPPKGSNPTQPTNNPNPTPPKGSNPTQPANNPNPTPSGGVSNNKITLKIINPEQVDGTAYTIGQRASLVAEAKDQKGTDLSAQIEWLNVEGETIGRGKKLNYDSIKTKNETIRARVKTPDGQEVFDRVSFTVSPSGVILASNVKVLKDEDQNNIIDLDFKEPGRVCLINDANLPTIKVNDVILGAGGIIPPLRVLKIESEFQQVESKQLEKICLTTVFAPLEEVFKETKQDISITPNNLPRKLNYNPSGGNWVDFKPYLDPKTGQPTNIKAKPQWTDYVVNCNRSGYKYRYDKRNNLDISNDGGKYNTGRHFPAPEQILPEPNQQYYFNVYKNTKASDQITLKDQNSSGRFTTTDRTRKEYNIDANLYFGYDFQPEVSGSIGFSLDNGLKLKLQGGANETLIAGLDLQAFYKYAEEYKKTLASIEGLEAPRIKFAIGPIPVWIDFPLFLDFNWNNGFQFELKDGVFGLLQAGYFDIGFEYERGFKTTKNADNLSALMVCGDIDMSGFTEPALIPRVQFLLYSVAGPEIGLKGYVRGDLTRPERVVNIVQPASNTTINRTTPISLQANLAQASKLPIKANAGFNLDGQILAANRLLFPPYKLEIIGKKCVSVGWGKWKKTWCTDPVEVSFDINKYFKRWTEFKINIAKTKDVVGSIPLSTEAFEQLKGVPMEDSIVVWQADGTTTLGTSELKSPATLQVGVLPPGTHQIKATVYAPLDTALEKPLGSSSVKINIQ